MSSLEGAAAQSALGRCNDYFNLIRIIRSEKTQ
jgi:hypothetical protein